MALVLPLRYFLFLLPKYIHVYAIIMHPYTYIDKRGVLQQEYSQTPILGTLSSLPVGSRYIRQFVIDRMPSLYAESNITTSDKIEGLQIILSSLIQISCWYVGPRMDPSHHKFECQPLRIAHKNGLIPCEPSESKCTLP